MSTSALADGFWTSSTASVVLMVIGFGLVVLVHELGHFLVAKRVGIKVEEFAIGFGKKLIGIRRGETEYRLNLLPLGGYVKMLGQDDFKPKEGEESDPRAFNNRPIWARTAVVSAGVVMNVILAAVLFMIVFWVGISFVPPQIGSVEAGYPADLVELPGGLGTGLRPGDEILSINGREIAKFDKLLITSTLSDEGEVFRMRVRRPGVDKPFEVGLATETIVPDRGAKLHVFGLGSPLSRVLDDSEQTRRYLKQLTGGKLQGGETIVQLDGTPIEEGWQLAALFNDVGPGPAEVVVERAGPDGAARRHTVNISPKLDWSRPAIRHIRLQAKRQDRWLFRADPAKPADANDRWHKVPEFHVLGLQPRMRIAATLEDSPAAEADLRIGDVIAAYGPGDTVPTVRQFNWISEQAEGAVPIRILRDGQTFDLQITPERHEGQAAIGFVWEPDDRHLVIADVVPHSPLARQAGLVPGSTITAVNDTPVATWAELIAAVSRIGPAGSVSLSYATPAGGPGRTDPQPMSAFGYDLSAMSFADYYAWPMDSLPVQALQGPPVRSGPGGALALGVRETGDFIVLTYATLKQFFKGRVSGTQFSGPVGIFRAGVAVGKRGAIWVVWLLAVISANLAVINFLPLPIVDGGHVVFLIIEKIRRRPLSVAVQNAVQIAGLVAIGIVFVLLTYNDIRQWLGSRWQ